jgi:hypothetical protein
MIQDPNDDCRYFLSYSGISLPFKLIEELEPRQIANRNTYFQGYYDGAGRLVEVRKMVYGEIEMQHRYEYDPSGALSRAEVIDSEGEVNVMEFGEAERS